MADQHLEIACPVCRAQQTPRPLCRRCGTDLALFLKAANSLKIARERYMTAQMSGDELLASRALKYLCWLSPAAARHLPNGTAG